MRRTVVGGLAAATLLALAPLSMVPAAQAASPVHTVKVTGTMRRTATTSLVLLTPKHSTITVYFTSITPLLSRFGRTLVQSEIKVGHQLVVTGSYQGKHAFYATVIEDTTLH